ncbi:hypothetical protein MRX96_019541 [Rhipicephalus microplus]
MNRVDTLLGRANCSASARLPRDIVSYGRSWLRWRQNKAALAPSDGCTRDARSDRGECRRATATTQREAAAIPRVGPCVAASTYIQYSRLHRGELILFHRNTASMHIVGRLPAEPEAVFLFRLKGTMRGCASSRESPCDSASFIQLSAHPWISGKGHRSTAPRTLAPPPFSSILPRFLRDR